MLLSNKDKFLSLEFLGLKLNGQVLREEPPGNLYYIIRGLAVVTVIQALHDSPVFASREAFTGQIALSTFEWHRDRFLGTIATVVLAGPDSLNDGHCFADVA